MPSQIRVNYEQLDNISQQFIDSANQADLVSQQMNACLDDIRAAWQADGVEPFISRLFDRIVRPLDTLRNALDETSFTIDQISQIMADAETEASQLFLSDAMLDLDSITQFATLLRNAAVAFTKADPLPLALPMQQAGTAPDPYWAEWNSLPDWLKPWTTSPWQTVQRIAFWQELYNGAFLSGRSSVASQLLFHYLEAKGDTYFVDSHDVLGNLDFMNGATSKFDAKSQTLLGNILKQQLDGQPISSFPLTISDPFTWSLQSRFGGDMTEALGTSTVNSGGNAKIQFTLVPDPTNSAQGTMSITVTQPMELYDRYDWVGNPIAYNSTNDTVAVSYAAIQANTPVLILDKSGKIVNTLPAGTDLNNIPNYTYVEYPPDSPDLGAAQNLYTLYTGGTLKPDAQTQVFGTPDHPHNIYAGEFHALEANGEARAFEVYSQWSAQQTYTISYTVVNGYIVVSGIPVANGTPQYTPSSYTAGTMPSGYTPAYTPPTPTYPQH